MDSDAGVYQVVEPGFREVIDDGGIFGTRLDPHVGIAEFQTVGEDIEGFPRGYDKIDDCWCGWEITD